MNEVVYTDIFKALQAPQKVLNLKVSLTQMELFTVHAKDFINLETLQMPRLKLREIPIQVSYFQKLKTLILNHNELETLPSLLALLPELKRINLDHNHFKTFPDCLLKIEKLEHISIDDNLFSRNEKERIMEIFPIWF
jgi:Leucine-rich repeat (LRR) protein